MTPKANPARWAASVVALLAAIALGAAIGRAIARRSAASPPGKAIATANISHAVTEGALTTIELSDETERRLQMASSPVERRPVAATRAVGGEVISPAGRSAVITAPVAGTLRVAGNHPPQPGERVTAGQVLFRLVPVAPADRDLRAQAERQVTSSAARHEAALSQKDRAEQLLEARAGSRRAAEDARTAEESARAELDAAKRRLALIQSAPLDADVSIPLRAPVAGVIARVAGASGQPVTAGTMIFEIADTKRVWIRAPVYVGELARLDPVAPAQVIALGDTAASARLAHPVAAPIVADANAATADWLYALDNNNGALRPGARVTVLLPYRSIDEAVVVPWSAIVYDFHGGAWVYEVTAQPRTYRRRRVEVARIDGERAILARGPGAATRVVSAGAAELFGVEFGGGK